MSKEFYYYRINGGAVKAAYDKFFALYKQQKEARNALCAEFGAKGCYANARIVSGLVFEHTPDVPPPAGWKQMNSEPTVYQPSGGSAAMKTIRKRLREDYPLADAAKFQECVLGTDNPFSFMDGLTIRFMVYEHVGEHLLLLVPKVGDGDAAKWTPPDDQCQLLKTSEYWQLKEQLEAKPTA